MQVVKLEDIPEEGLNLKWTDDRSSLSAYIQDFSRVDFDFETSLQSQVRIQKIGESVLVRGDLETELRLKCVRCLKEFTYPLTSAFELNLHPAKEGPTDEETELEEQDMESGFFEEGEIHLSEIACEQVFLEIPYQPICSEGCKGLCPVCGQDLNLSPCNCVEEKFSSGFAALEKLKLN